MSKICYWLRMEFKISRILIIFALCALPNAVQASCEDLLKVRIEQASELENFSEPISFVGFRYGDAFAWNENNPNFTEHQQLLMLADQIRAIADKPLRTIIYPAAGYDAGTAFKIFGDAELIIGIDNHPFTLKGETRTKNIEIKKDLSGFVIYSDIKELMNDVGMASAILSQLAYAIPNLRIRKILATPNDGSGSHGCIEFDTGPDTQVRRYLHLYYFFSNPHYADRIQKLLQIGFDAVLIKGSMELFHNEDPKIGANFILTYLSETEGIAVDTDRRTAEGVAALSSLPPLFPLPRQNYELTNTGLSIGYNVGSLNKKGTAIIKYLPKR